MQELRTGIDTPDLTEPIPMFDDDDVQNDLIEGIHIPCKDEPLPVIIDELPNHKFELEKPPSHLMLIKELIKTVKDFYSVD